MDVEKSLMHAIFSDQAKTAKDQKNIQLRMPDSLVGKLALLAIVFSFYYFSGKLGLALATVHPSVSAIWPATGIAIACMIVFGYRLWPLFFVGSFFFNYTTNWDIASSIAIGFGNMIEGLIGAFWVNKYANGRFAFSHPASIFKFLVLAGLIAPIFSATIGITSLVLSGLAPLSSFASIWFTWWIGNVTGAIIVAPFIILWSNNLRVDLDVRKILEIIAFISALIVFTPIIFLNVASLKFLTIPFVIWSAFRFGQKATSLFILLLSGIILFGLLGSTGIYEQNQFPNLLFLVIQAFIAITSLIGLTVSCVVSENYRKTEMLMKSEEELQKRVVKEVEKVKKNQERFQTLFENAPDIITMCSAEGVINSVNPALKRITGWKPEEVIGKNLIEIVYPEDISAVKNYFIEVSDGQTHAPIEVRFLKKSGGHVWIGHLRRPVLENGNITGAFSINRDITERKHAQQLLEQKFEIEKRNEEQKMEFLTMTSHELKTPLTPVLIQGELLLDGSFGKLSKQQKKVVEIIVRNVKRFNDLINDIFDITRIHTTGIKSEMQETDISRVIRESVENMKISAAKKNITITSKIAKLPPIIAAPNRIQQVMTNLLDNAIKYTDKNGKINVVALKEKGGILVKVSDTGIGIEQKHLEMIFYHFYQARSSPLTKNSGTGLGLAICRRIIEMHGGKIWAESAVGNGSTFYFSLPTLQSRKS